MQIECKRCGARFPPTHTHQCGEPQSPAPDPHGNGPLTGGQPYTQSRPDPQGARIAELEAQLRDCQDEIARLMAESENTRAAFERCKEPIERIIAQRDQAHEEIAQLKARLPQAAERAQAQRDVIAAARVPAVMDALREASERHDPDGSQFFATARSLSDALKRLDALESGGWE